MRFQRLDIRNWRSFKGAHHIEFAKDLTRNVTVLVGQNGSGKTALLNAFTWVLFGVTTAGFRRPNDLFNHSALDAIEPGASDSVEVTLEFEHDGAMYQIRRWREATRPRNGGPASSGDTKLAATRTRRGITEAIEQAQIDSVLPPGLHPFFFFPAENIGKDIDQNDAASIRADMSRAIDVLLGIERYDNALRVISTALSSHLKGQQNAPKDATVATAEEELNGARAAWDQAESRKKLLPGLIEEARQLAEDLSRQLQVSDEHASAVQELNDTKAAIDKAQATVETAREDQLRVINRNCVVLFGYDLFTDGKAVLDRAHKNGEIPPRVSAGLLDELLNERKECICGTEIREQERSRLESLRSRTVDDFVAETASNLRGRIPRLIEGEDGRLDSGCVKEVLDCERKIGVAESQIAKLKMRLQELINDSPGVGHMNPAKTREAWQAQERTLLRLQDEQKNIDKTLPALELAKREAERRYQGALTKNVQAKSVGKARHLLSNVEETLSQIQAAVRASAKKDVERAMNDFYAPLLLKHYKVRLTDDFHYQITDETTGRTVGASSSEVALATFAFVGALAALMPVYASLERLIPADDGKSVGSLRADAASAYPVVLDAPYSPFGPEYAGDFSKALPNLLPQSVIIVRADQLEHVSSILEGGRVGAAYVLRLHAGQGSPKTVLWQGKEFGYVLNTLELGAPYTDVVLLPVE